MLKKGFASDNYSGVHPKVMDALNHANRLHAPSYGADPFTASAIDRFRQYFGDGIEVFFVYNGTGANVLGLKAVTQSYHSIFCSELAHINVDESTAPEAFTGCKLVPVPHVHGKISPEDIERRIIRLGDQHHPQGRVISISQTTEYATVYTPEEIRSLSELAKRHNMILHMDGSRIANAASALGRSFREFTRDAGVDVLSFGGTKNGLMFGEAVIFFSPQPAVPYLRKQAMQLHSKMRFISAQFEALLSEQLWESNAAHANRMARRLAEGLSALSQVRITQPVEANGVFAILPRDVIAPLQEAYPFYVWNETLSEVRLMCSFDTTEDEVDGFVKTLKARLTTVSA